ncbi:hypothetical protein AB6A40_001599 [Gnathostoma spinigerum]|uniref:Uncharacterized protein n=1 Tax=Gnathostoma spinigerum TaxID=75299 RepID=A0ABD6E5J5_9BILA
METRSPIRRLSHMLVYFHPLLVIPVLSLYQIPRCPIDSLPTIDNLLCILTNNNGAQSLLEQETSEIFENYSHVSIDATRFIYVLNDSQPTQFVLPTSIMGKACSGYVNVVTNEAIESECTIRINSHSGRDSISNAMFDAQTFADLIFTTMRSNRTHGIQPILKNNVLRPKWINDSHVDELRKVFFTFFMELDELVNVMIEFLYGTPTKMNNTDVTVSFVVTFVETNEYAKDHAVNKLLEAPKQIQTTLVSRAECSLSETLIRLGYLNYYSSECKLNVTDCTSTRSLIDATTIELLKFFERTFYLSTNLHERQPMHRTDPQLRLISEDLCHIPSAITFAIGYIHYGSLNVFTTQAVGITYEVSSTQRVSISSYISSNLSIVLSVQFSLLPNEKYVIHKAPPNLEISLPNDFFYPFSSQSTCLLNHCVFCISMFLMLIFGEYT